MKRLRKAVALLLSATTFGFAADLPHVRVDKPTGNVLVRPYEVTSVPPVQATNSTRLAQLIRGGALYLTVQDAIALALENNIDLEIDRYNPLLSQWAVQRAEAGGVQRGVNTSAGQAIGVTSGLGVQGSASTVGTGNLGGGSGASSVPAGNAVVSQVGPVAPNLDTSITSTTIFSHTTTPEANTILAGSSALVDLRRSFQQSVQQGFLTGGSLSYSFNSNYLNENSPNNALNPATAPDMGLSLSQNLLSGFGVAVNNRTIRVAKNNVTVSDLTFEAQVVTVVSNVLVSYWTLVSDDEDLHAKQSALELARKLYEDNGKQVKLGTLAPIEITRAEAQVATGERDVDVSQTTALQAETRLKNVISRNGIADPVLANVRIVPVDRMDIPAKVDLPPFEKLVQQALATRPDLKAERLDLQNAEINSLGTKNGVLPSLRGILSADNRGLTGTPNALARAGSTAPDSYFVGGYGNGIAQIFRHNFGSVRGGVFYSATLHNRVNQADYGIEQLQLRQTQIDTSKDLNQVAVDVSNQMIALRQAHARYESATQSLVLEQQLLDAEQKKYSLGTSTTYNVIQIQRDLATANSNKVSAMTAYAQAKIGLDRVLGTELDTYHISIDQARAGIYSNSANPATPQQ